MVCRTKSAHAGATWGMLFNEQKGQEFIFSMVAPCELFEESRKCLSSMARRNSARRARTHMLPRTHRRHMARIVCGTSQRDCSTTLLARPALPTATSTRLARESQTAHRAAGNVKDSPSHGLFISYIPFVRRVSLRRLARPRAHVWKHVSTARLYGTAFLKPNWLTKCFSYRHEIHGGGDQGNGGAGGCPWPPAKIHS